MSNWLKKTRLELIADKDEATLESLLNILNETKFKKLSDEDKVVFDELMEELIQLKTEREQYKRTMMELEEDFKHQVETNNFRFLCGGCVNGCIPRCLNLYEKKYCRGYRGDCKSKKANPEYVEN